MSASRPILLPFLYPMLYRPGRVSHSAPKYLRQAGIAATPSSRRPFGSSTGPRQQEARPRRYGTANEPPPHLDPSSKPAIGSETVKKSDSPSTQPEESQDANSSEPLEPSPEDDILTPAELSEASKQDATSTRAKPPHVGATLGTPELETVFQMPSPAEAAKSTLYLRAPPYVHHFDTYSLVRRLSEGGFSEPQSVTVMKAVRGLLTTNMEVARNSLVSKSNVENETYLFRAACSELKMEIENNRKSDIEKMRTERLQLQHEVEILSQRLAQESQSLKDDLKGLFDDRGMAVRIEQKDMEGKIQELNYKISIALNSDSRSDIEGLRWIVARRAAIAVAISAIMILSTLKYASYMSHMQAAERQKHKTEKDAKRSNEGSNSGFGNGNSNNHSLIERAIEEAGTEGLLVAEGGDKGFVSLG